MRHAEAQSPLAAANDFDRVLTEKGISDASKASQFLFESELSIDQLIYSSAARTTTTAQLIGELNKMDAPDMEANEQLYNAPVGTVLDLILRLNNDWETVMLVGHNPTFSYLAEYLTDHSPINLLPSHLVSIQFEVESWTMLTQGLGRLEWIHSGSATA